MIKDFQKHLCWYKINETSLTKKHRQKISFLLSFYRESSTGKYLSSQKRYFGLNQPLNDDVCICKTISYLFFNVWIEWKICFIITWMKFDLHHIQRNLSKADTVGAKISVCLIEALFDRFYFSLHQSVPKTTVRFRPCHCLRGIPLYW